MWLEQFPIVVCLIQMYSYPLLYSEAHWYPARLFAGGGGMKSCAVFLSLFDFIPEQSPKGKMASSWDTRFCQNTYRGLIRFLVIPEFLELNLNSKHSLVNYIQSYGIIELYTHLKFDSWLNIPCHMSSSIHLVIFSDKILIISGGSIFIWQCSCEN